MRLALFGAAAAIVLALLYGAYSWAWQRGHDAHAAATAAATRDLNARLMRAAEDQSRAAAALARAETDLRDLERRLSDEARDDPLAGDPGLGADSLRRLDAIR